MSAEIKTKRLFVGNLSFATRWYELKDHFKQAGNVTYANIIRDRRSKRSRGCGIVEMETLEQAQQAVKTLHETELAARKIFVREDQRPATSPKDTKDETPKQNGQQERKPRAPKKESTQQGEKKPQEKRERGEKKPQGEKKAVAEKKEVKAEEKKDTAAPATTTTAAPQAEGEKQKKKRRRSKKKKATTTTTATTATTSDATPAPQVEKKEGDDGEGEFREIKRRERRGRGTSRGGSRGGRTSEPRVPKEKPTTESGETAPAPRVKKERQPDPTKSSGKAIFVSNLPLTMKQEELNQLFTEAGAISSSELKTDKAGKARGLATVLFETPEAAQKAITVVNEKEVGGRKINVRLDFYQ